MSGVAFAEEGDSTEGTAEDAGTDIVVRDLMSGHATKGETTLVLSTDAELLSGLRTEHEARLARKTDKRIRTVLELVPGEDQILDAILETRAELVVVDGLSDGDAALALTRRLAGVLPRPDLVFAVDNPSALEKRVASEGLGFAVARVRERIRGFGEVSDAELNLVDGTSISSLEDVVEAFDSIESEFAEMVKGFEEYVQGEGTDRSAFLKTYGEAILALKRIYKGVLLYRRGVLCKEGKTQTRLQRAFVHDLGNSLSVFDTLPCLTKEFFDNECLGGFLDDVLEAIGVAKDAVSNFLSTIEVGDRPCLLDPILKRFVDAAELMHRLSVQLTYATDNVLPGFTCDPTKLHLVLMNFASNAAKHGGATTLNVCLSEGGNGELLIDVSNDGANLSEDFDLAARAASAVCGETGNGMRDISGLVAQLGGSFEMLRREGSAFRITLLASQSVDEGVSKECVAAH